MEFAFDCPTCGQRLAADRPAGGQQVKCPACGAALTVPENPPATASAPENSDILYCTKCGQKNHENNFKCTRCGFVLHEPVQPQYTVSSDGTLGGLLPYKNIRALWAYYLGVFSLIPLLGIPLGIAALIMGIKARMYADLHPEAQGRAHAWTGILLGMFCAAANIAVVASFFLFY